MMCSSSSLFADPFVYLALLSVCGALADNFLFPNGNYIFHEGDTVEVSWETSASSIYLYLNGPDPTLAGQQMLADSFTTSYPWVITNQSDLYYFALHQANNDGSVGLDTAHSPTFTVEVGDGAPLTWNSNDTPPASTVSPTSTQGSSAAITTSPSSSISTSPSTSTSISSPTAAMSTPGTSSEASGLNTGGIIGIAFGAVSALAGTIGTVLFWMSRRESGKNKQHAESDHHRATDGLMQTTQHQQGYNVNIYRSTNGNIYYANNGNGNVDSSAHISSDV